MIFNKFLTKKIVTISKKTAIILTSISCFAGNSFANSNSYPLGITPLMTAVTSNDISGVNFFTENDPFIIDKQNIGGASALHIASRNGYDEIVKILLEKSAQVDISDNEGFTPAMRAVLANEPKILDILASYGARLDFLNSYGDSTITLAAKSSCNECLETMFKKYDFALFMGYSNLKKQLDQAYEISKRQFNEKAIQLILNYSSKVLSFSQTAKSSEQEILNLNSNPKNQKNLLQKSFNLDSIKKEPIQKEVNFGNSNIKIIDVSQRNNMQNNSNSKLVEEDLLDKDLLDAKITNQEAAKENLKKENLKLEENLKAQKELKVINKPKFKLVSPETQNNRVKNKIGANKFLNQEAKEKIKVKIKEKPVNEVKNEIKNEEQIKAEIEAKVEAIKKIRNEETKKINTAIKDEKNQIAKKEEKIKEVKFSIKKQDNINKPEAKFIFKSKKNYSTKALNKANLNEADIDENQENDKKIIKYNFQNSDEEDRKSNFDQYKKLQEIINKNEVVNLNNISNKEDIKVFGLIESEEIEQISKNIHKKHLSQTKAEDNKSAENKNAENNKTKNDTLKEVNKTNKNKENIVKIQDPINKDISQKNIFFKDSANLYSLVAN